MFIASRKNSKQPMQANSRQDSNQSGRSGRTFLTGMNDQSVLDMNPSDIQLFAQKKGSIGGAQANKVGAVNFNSNGKVSRQQERRQREVPTLGLKTP